MNSYEIRNHFLSEVKHSAKGVVLIEEFLFYLRLCQPNENLATSDKNYLRCAISGFNHSKKNLDELSRLLGQSSFMDGVPMPWVADVWSVLGIKLAVEQSGDSKLIAKFPKWLSEFLPQIIRDGKLNLYERAIAEYIQTNEIPMSSASCIALFLHYKDMLRILSDDQKKKHVENFLKDFQESYKTQHPALLLALFVFVFDKINDETAVVPPHLWRTKDIVSFLENIPAGLKRWTWDDKPKTKNSNAAKWLVENEYHVQNLLYVLLGPIFPDISDEMHTAPLGQKHPRIDLYLPSIDTVIEVKYKKDTKKNFQDLIGEVAEDLSLYRSDPKFKKSTLLVFLWDHTRATEEHIKFKEGVMLMSGINGCIVICSPSVIN